MVITGARLMPKFTLIAEHTDLYGKPNGHKVTHEFNVDTLNDVLENFDSFLRGCGFVPTGTLDYVDDSLEDWTFGESIIQEHHDSYFDTERNK
jgi:hypothetical protein